MWWRSIIFMAVFFGALIAALPLILWLGGYAVGRIFSYRLPFAPFGYTSLALLLIFWVVLAYGRLVGMWQVRVSELEYTCRDLPAAFDGYRIVHISDLHVDTFSERPEHLRAIVDKVNTLAPDAVLFTGDMQSGGIDGVFAHADALRQLSARDGVFSVLGNHDFFIYDPEYHSDSERVAAAWRLADFEADELGWTVLRNENVRIERTDSCGNRAGIVIAGIDNINGNEGFSTIQAGDLSAALEGVEAGEFTVLLSHDPSFWRAAVVPLSHVQLTLSGHTHAAQVRLFGHSLASLSFRENDGRYDTEDGRMLYVNAGIGCTVPMRIGCPSEITVITLRAAGRN